MAKIKKYYDIKYPFTKNNEDGLFIDLNETKSDKVLSEILHVILTRKGERLRNPNFGTNLVEFIFNPNDKLSWETVKEEVKGAISKYVPNVKINDIEVLANESDDSMILLKISYSVKNGIDEENNIVTVKL